MEAPKASRRLLEINDGTDRPGLPQKTKAMGYETFFPERLCTFASDINTNRGSEMAGGGTRTDGELDSMTAAASFPEFGVIEPNIEARALSQYMPTSESLRYCFTLPGRHLFASDPMPGGAYVEKCQHPGEVNNAAGECGQS